LTVAVVIPAYNEAATIRAVAQDALAQLPHVVVVDDGSIDGTSEALAGLAVTLLRNPRNRGKAAAMFIGAQAALRAGATAVLTIDGDGQHDPGDIPRLLRAAAASPGAIVIGSRLHAKAAIPKARYLANRFANFWIAWAAGQPIVDTQSGFRVYPAAVFRDLSVRHSRWASFVFESEVLIEASQAGVGVVCVPVTVSYANPARRSHFRPVADIAKIVVMVAGRLLRRGLNVPGLVRSLRGSGGFVGAGAPGLDAPRK
jgi:glycosyltransferase involved in cell wall biosynthesis